MTLSLKQRGSSYAIRCRLELALLPGDRAEDPVMAPIMARRLASEARVSVELLSPRRDRRVKDALERVLDAIEVLEREMQWVWRRQLNEQRGLVLESTWLTLTPEGVLLERGLPTGPGVLHLGLVLAGSWRLLSLPVVTSDAGEARSLLRWVDLDAASADTLAALALDLQRKERRRARAVVD